MPVPDARMKLMIDGAWVDVTDHVRRAGRIKHRRGRREGGARVDPSTATWTIESPGGLYSNRNPRSPYFGKLGRNTPALCTVAGPGYLIVQNAAASYASTPDHASLDLTGDLDIRVEAAYDDWNVTGSNPMELVGKWGASGDQSWMLTLWNDGILLYWTANGSTQLTATSTANLAPPISGRMAVRATLDVDNGAGGRTITYYTGPSIDGPWTQLGTPTVQAGVTSVYPGTGALRVGSAGSIFDTASGKVFGFELRNGIGGAVVAAPDFTAAADGATSLVDSTGKTWTVEADASISNRWTRFNLSVPEWPPSWHASGNNVTASLTGAGTLRRLGQGRKALDSTLRRRIPSYGPLAYWPMEDQGDAVSAASPIDGVSPLRASFFNWSSTDTLASSSPLPSISPSTGRCIMQGTIPAPSGSISAWSVIWLYRLDQINTSLSTFMRILSTGTVREWYIQFRNDMTRILARDVDGNTVFQQDISTSTDLYNQWMRVKFAATQNGGNVDWSILWTDVGGDAGTFTGSFAGTLGRPTGVASPPGGFSTALNGMAIGHISAWAQDWETPYLGAVDAWAGETAGERIARLSAEESVPVVQYGDNDLQQRMGPQLPATLLDLLGECEATDGGILYEDRESTDLRFRDRASMYNQDPALTIPYAQLAPPLTPVDDDQHIRNDVTRQRAGGSSARVVVEDGPLSVLPPEDGGVGIYDESVTLSMYDDTQPLQIAGWAAHLGTWDEARYPSVRIYLHQYPALVEQVLALDVGDKIRITDLPDFLPPGPVDLIVQGYEEEIDQFAWTVTLFCAPAGPWRVMELDGGEESRLDTAGSELAAAVDADDTTLYVSTTLGPRWVDSPTYPTDFPIPVAAGGEEMTATAITAGASDAFGRTVASGWGTADIGGAWTTSGGSASDYGVGSGYGSHTQSTVNVQRRTTLTSPGADFDIYVDVTTSATATGASLNAGPITRALDGSNFYHARLEFTTANAIILTLRKRIAGTETQLATYTAAITHTPGTFVRVRFQGTGTALKAKVWLASASEPGVWHVEATATELTAAAAIGVRSFATTGNTNASPQARFDNFALVNPQAFTVTRSVNGVAKAHAAGADIALAYPNYVPL